MKYDLFIDFLTVGFVENGYYIRYKSNFANSFNSLFFILL